MKSIIPDWAEHIKPPAPKFSAEEIASVRSMAELHPIVVVKPIEASPKRETITLKKIKGKKHG